MGGERVGRAGQVFDTPQRPLGFNGLLCTYPSLRPPPPPLPQQVFGFLRKHIHDEATVEEVKRVTLTADGRGACFDVPTNLAKVGGCLRCGIPRRLSLHMGCPHLPTCRPAASPAVVTA